MRKGTTKPDTAKIMSRQEVAALLCEGKKLGAVPYLLFSTIYLLGLRIGEAVLLRYEHLRRPTHDGGLYYVTVPTLKRSVTQGLLICPETKKPLIAVPVLSHDELILAAFKREFRSGQSRGADWLFTGSDRSIRPMSKAWVNRLWHTLIERGKLDHAYTPHTLRHSAATHLYHKAGKMTTVTRFLRHTPGSGFGSGPGQASVTNLYVHATDETWLPLRGALDLPPLRPLRAAD